MELSHTETNKQSPDILTQNQPEAATVEKANTVNTADIVTITEALKRLGPDAPTPNAFHKAVERGRLKTQPQQEGDKTFRFLWNDILEWRALGATKKRGSSKKRRNKGSKSGKEAHPSAPISNVGSEQALPSSITSQLGPGFTPATSPETMNGKPVLYRDGKTILTDPSEEFHEKLLCDGLVFNMGDACGFSCTYCYVESVMIKLDKEVLDLHNQQTGQNLGFGDVVIRRRNSIEVLRSQLVNQDGTRIYDDPEDDRVVYSSTLVDAAANSRLLKETAEACNLILEHTNWHIRLLSKSSSLVFLIKREMIPKKYHHRLILGFSIGTRDDDLASAIEINTGKVTKRIEALHWLQDHGIRTFGMICPSLPQEDYDKFSRDMCAALRVERCEHVWTEVINLRGRSLIKTIDALIEAGYETDAKRLKAVSGTDGAQKWEEYARATFLAHTKNIPCEKLRHLQYIDKNSADWWKDQRENGAVLLGAEANIRQLTAGGESAPSEPLPALEPADEDYLAEREAIVDSGIKASIVAAQALYEIKTYRKGKLWRKSFRTFEQYLRERWDYQKSQGYHLVDVGGFVAELGCSDSAIAEKLPVNEGQLRPMFKVVPKEHRVACWAEITADKHPSELTGPMVGAGAKKFAKKIGLQLKQPKIAKSAKSAKPTPEELAKREMENLRSALEKLPQPERFNLLLQGIAILIDQDPDEGVIEVTVTEVERASEPKSVEDIRQSA